PKPFYLGVAFVVVGFAVSELFVGETHHHVAHEAALVGPLTAESVLSPGEVFWRTSLADRNLSSVCQAGLVNNLNDRMAWGLFPPVSAPARLNLAQIGLRAAVYPATWSLLQLATGVLSDRTGRKPFIVWGMWIQALGIAVVTAGQSFSRFLAGELFLG